MRVNSKSGLVRGGTEEEREMNVVKSKGKGMDKKGQVAIFVIVAIVIVGGIVAFFALKDVLFVSPIAPELRGVFDYYEQCLDEETRGAISLVESQGGRVDPGEYAPGSEYAPFSSQLNFLGFPVPYWFYVSGNGIVKQNVPTRSEMESEMADYIENQIAANCDFYEFYDQGFDVGVSEPRVDVDIDSERVSVDLSSELVVSRGESTSRKTSYDVEIDSKLGKLFATAREIYERQRDDMFLENYSVDVMRLYAPVDGVEISCSGKIWKTREVVDELKDALEANIGMIKFEGDYYSTDDPDDRYFVVDMQTDEAVNLIYSKNWPTKIEIFGADEELMVAEPVGNQPGMGIMGFCYAPYHFVYDISYPVMIQVMEGTEIFQFPVVVIIDKNMPRNAVLSDLVIEAEEEVFDLCEFNTQDVEVNVYDAGLRSVDANLSYMCFSQQCDLGETDGGRFVGSAPACLNGYLKVDASGYTEKRLLFSTNEESFIDVIIDREYDVELELYVGGSRFDDTAIVMFQSDSRVISTALPETERVKLSEGLYNVTVYAYSDSKLTLPASTKTQCHDVVESGFLGIFGGGTRGECFDITIPETEVEAVLAGGGRAEMYLLPSDLEAGRLRLEVESLPKPDSLEQLQANFIVFEKMGVWVS